ncbi:MAG: stage II sporulation protein P [Bacillota bacterium]|nr:stage II sporulation protein P [Bacillota bacterium]
MPAARYQFPYGSRMPLRYRSGKKYLPGRDLVSFLLIGAAVLLTVFFSFNTFFSGSTNTSNAFFSKGIRVDYLNLIRQSLPGMRLKAGEDISGDNISVDLKWPVYSYPKILLHNGLVGFSSMNSSQALLSAITDEYVEELASPQPPVEEKAESVSFLTERRYGDSREFPVTSNSEQPLMLIYHTHASESFIPLSGSAFSDNPEKTVVFLGAYLAQLLEDEYGIPVLHHQEVFDVPRTGAYEVARPSIQEILKQNPQIQVVVDLHRDGVSRRVSTTTLGGDSTGNILFVVGKSHSQWSNNLRFVLFLQNTIAEKYPGLSRGVRQYPFIYNQDLHPRNVLVEIGGHENTREEVVRAIPYLAEVLAGAFE